MDALDSETSPEHTGIVTADIELSIWGQRLELELAVPAGEVPAESLLPLLQSFSNIVMDIVEQGAKRGGLAISCQKGCGACCRQPVPVTRAEARQLASLVAALPDADREKISRRFEAAVERIRAAGLAEQSRAFHEMDKEERVAFTRAYFSLGIACPFLEDESCSIHEDRPLICREYLVTSPPEFCAKLDGKRIDGLPRPASVFWTFGQLDGMDEGGTGPSVLLTSALESAATTSGAEPRRPGPEWLQEFFQKLSGSEIPDPSPFM